MVFMDWLWKCLSTCRLCWGTSDDGQSWKWGWKFCAATKKSYFHSLNYRFFFPLFSRFFPIDNYLFFINIIFSAYSLFPSHFHFFGISGNVKKSKRSSFFLPTNSPYVCTLICEHNEKFKLIDRARFIILYDFRIKFFHIHVGMGEGRITKRKKRKLFSQFFFTYIRWRMYVVYILSFDRTFYHNIHIYIFITLISQKNRKVNQNECWGCDGGFASTRKSIRHLLMHFFFTNWSESSQTWWFKSELIFLDFYKNSIIQKHTYHHFFRNARIQIYVLLFARCRGLRGRRHPIFYFQFQLIFMRDFTTKPLSLSHKSRRLFSITKNSTLNRQWLSTYIVMSVGESEKVNMAV